MKIKVILAGLLITANAHAATLTATTTTKAFQALGYANQTTYLVCSHDASVTNNTGAPQVVHVYYSICADNAGCTTKGYKIKVGNGTWHDTASNNIYTIYKHPGHYRLTCKTIVDGLSTQEDYADIGIN